MSTLHSARAVCRHNARLVCPRVRQISKRCVPSAVHVVLLADVAQVERLWASTSWSLVESACRLQPEAQRGGLILLRCTRVRGNCGARAGG